MGELDRQIMDHVGIEGYLMKTLPSIGDVLFSYVKLSVKSGISTGFHCKTLNFNGMSPLIGIGMLI